MEERLQGKLNDLYHSLPRRTENLKGKIRLSGCSRRQLTGKSVYPVSKSIAAVGKFFTHPLFGRSLNLSIIPGHKSGQLLGLGRHMVDLQRLPRMHRGYRRLPN